MSVHARSDIALTHRFQDQATPRVMDDEEKFLYLKNVVYKYIIGGVHNAESLVRVIASILRFTVEEERTAIEKERSRSVCAIFS